MEQLRINSERYSQTISSISSLETRRGLKPQSGKRDRRTHHGGLLHVNITEVGEFSLAPDEGEIFTSTHASRPILIAIGSTLYSYSPSIARRDGGRPWVLFSGSGGASGGTSFPYHGQSKEANAGGTGSYAGLINLLATTVGGVDMVGAASVDGQQTIEFTAVVKPLSFTKGLSQKERAIIKKHSLSERISLFLAESGLPVRVITLTGSGSNTISETTDILAVNIPVKVKRPPANRTIGEAKLLKLPGGKTGHSRPS